MPIINSSDKESFENDGQVFYCVSYLGEGPVENRVPDDVIGRRTKNILGMLYLSLNGVIFVTDEFEYALEFSMYDLEGEEACYENRIPKITLLYGHERRHYFDIAKADERSLVVYRPYWINYGKNYKKSQKRNKS